MGDQEEGGARSSQGGEGKVSLVETGLEVDLERLLMCVGKEQEAGNSRVEMGKVCTEPGGRNVQNVEKGDKADFLGVRGDSAKSGG